MAIRSSAVGALLATALLISGCYVGPAPNDYYVGGTVAVAPPPAQYEVAVGVAPGPGYVWAGGYWGWVGGRYAWTPGRWIVGRPGFRYVSHHWVAYRGGWRMVGGHWERR